MEHEVTEGRQILPKAVRPSHYSLTLTPDMENFTFQGDISIKVTFHEKTNKIVLNSNELEIETANLKFLQSGSEKSYEATDILYDEESTTATLCFSTDIPAGTGAEVHMTFSGILNDEMNGFYRSRYDEQGDDKRYMAATQFEATDARKAFPCWDEPAIKATFDIALRVPMELVALSNMDVISEVPISGSQLKEVRFSTTPIISTYLIAFIVGDLDHIESYTTGKFSGNPVKCRVYARRGTSIQGQFALDVCTRILELFDEVFGTPYPLPKMDMVAVPDFDGAMENWGIISFCPALLLSDEETSSTKAKQNIAGTVAHEVAHQWFGNLVTMEWWSHLWLNEGFATWVGIYAVDKLFPEWDFWTQFVVEDFEEGLVLDSLKSSHPIETEVKDPDEIVQIFDDISYSKGASVIRMLSAYLTEEIFLSGVRSYLKKHMYGNASTEDLWIALSEESGQDVSKFMKLWTKQVGYPYLEVTEEQNDTEILLTIRQKRYLTSGNITQEEDQNLWWVPLSLVTTQSDFKPDIEILTERETKLKVPKEGTYKLNYQYTGIFRTKYPTSAIKKLGQLISNGQLLTSRDRIGIISDSASLAQSGIGSSTDFLELLKNFSEEKEYVVWSQVAAQLENLLSIWFEEPENIQRKLQKICCQLFEKVVQRLGWEVPSNETVLDGQLRALAIQNAGLNGDEVIIEEARRRFNMFVNGDQNALHPDLRAEVYQVVINQGGEKEYNAVKKIYRETKTPDQRLDALCALGYVTQPKLISDALEFSISEEVRHQDVGEIMGNLGSNPKSRRQTWSFVKSHWKILEDRYSSKFDILGYIIKDVASELSTKEDAKDFESFFEDKDTSKFVRLMDQTLESIQLNTDWLNRDRNNVEEWLSAHIN